jgi:putative spermidine/putrescine transport system ATP-binding protein
VSTLETQPPSGGGPQPDAGSANRTAASAAGQNAGEAGLVLSHVTKRLGGREIVTDMNLEVAKGELVCLLGPSGCGKTTTLRMIGGFLSPDSGEVVIGGERHTKTPPERRPTAMVFQSYALWPHMTVFKNVAFGLTVRKLPRAQIKQRVEQTLELVGLSHHRDSHPGQISGGEQQRVALARALVLEPRLLLLDEPLSNLDAKLRVRVREDIREIQQRIGITTIFVTHDQEEALAMADRIAVMNQGRIEQYAPPNEIYREPATPFVATFVGTINLVRATTSGSGGDVSYELAPGVRVPYLGPAVPVGASASGVVGVRPEDVVVTEPGSDPRAARGRVIRDVPLGHYRELLIEVGPARLRAFVSSSAAPPRAEVGVAFARAVDYDAEAPESGSLSTEFARGSDRKDGL